MGIQGGGSMEQTEANRGADWITGERGVQCVEVRGLRARCMEKYEMNVGKDRFLDTAKYNIAMALGREAGSIYPITEVNG